MRILFALLVLLNLAFWLWQYAQPAYEEADRPPPPPAGVERLILLEERAEESKGEADGATSDPEPPPRSNTQGTPE